MARTKRNRGKKVASKKSWRDEHSFLFQKNPKNFSVGGDKQHPRDLSRFVKFPRYIRVQRQRAILKQRLKTPPALNQFNKTLDKNQAQVLFQLLAAYRPESKQEKKQRLQKQAESEMKDAASASTKPKVVKFGLNHVTTLVETKKAKLVVIAHDVDPIELVVWLPALCRKMDVPYVIVKGKARLGQLVHQKTCAAVAITEVKKEDSHKLAQFISNARPQFNDLPEKERRQWGSKVLGIKRQHIEREIEKQRIKELQKQA